MQTPGTLDSFWIHSWSCIGRWQLQHDQGLSACALAVAILKIVSPNYGVYALMTSHLDYHNTIFMGLPLRTVQKFQLYCGLCC